MRPSRAKASRTTSAFSATLALVARYGRTDSRRRQDRVAGSRRSADGSSDVDGTRRTRAAVRPARCAARTRSPGIPPCTRITWPSCRASIRPPAAGFSIASSTAALAEAPRLFVAGSSEDRRLAHQPREGRLEWPSPWHRRACGCRTRASSSAASARSCSRPVLVELGDRRRHQLDRPSATARRSIAARASPRTRAADAAICFELADRLLEMAGASGLEPALRRGRSPAAR